MTYFSECTTQNDLLLIIDVSASLEGNYDIQNRFVKNLVMGLNFQFSRTRLAFITYARQPSLNFLLNKYTTQRDILNALKISEIGSQTNIAAPLRLARDTVFQDYNGDRNGVDNTVVLLTDGMATEERNSIEGIVNTMRGTTKFFTVALGESPDIDVLQKITSSPESTYGYSIKAPNDVDGVVNRILDILCT